VYCTKCGKQNDDDAAFCKFCGASLMGAPPMGAPPQGAAGPEWDHRGRRGQEECDRECQHSSRGSSWVWGLVVIVIGLWIIFNWALPNIDIPGLPQWVSDFNFWWIIPLLIGLIIVSIGARMIYQRGQPK
jgi:hypothetical protein